MKKKSPYLWVALTPYDFYDREGKNYVGSLSTIIFSGITWECTSDFYLPFVLNVADKKAPYLRLGYETFELLGCKLDREDDLHDIKLSLAEAARFLNYILYEYKYALESQDGRRRAYKYKFNDKGTGKLAFKTVWARIKAKELIRESDLVEIAKYNFND